MALSGRIYTAAFSNATISAIQDLFSLSNGSTKVIALQRIVLGQVTATSVANARLRIRRFTSTITVGSGGATIAANPVVPGDAATAVTVRSGDTTQSTGAAAIDINDEAWAIPGGYLWLPIDSKRPPMLKLSELFTLSLDQTIASLVCNGSIDFEEVP